MRLCLASTASTKLARLFFLTAIVLCAASLAFAGTITTYTGSDDGASTTGPWPNSSAAQTAFLAAAGSTTLVDFENVPLGYYTPIVPNGSVSIDLNAPNFGDGFSGISSTTFGNLYGFNTTPGGAQWYGFPGGSSTFNFASPMKAFGFWITGVQTVFTTSFTLTFNDGTSETLNLPINTSGGTSYFAFTDTASFSSLTITNASNDAWGIDDVSYGAGGTSTPEPSSLMLLGSGALGLAGMLRRKLMQ
jgi:hypothetical protein